MVSACVAATIPAVATSTASVLARDIETSLREVKRKDTEGFAELREELDLEVTSALLETDRLVNGQPLQPEGRCPQMQQMESRPDLNKRGCWCCPGHENNR